MKRFKQLLTLAAAAFFGWPSCCAQPSKDTLAAAGTNDTIIVLPWQQLANGIDYCETNAPFKSRVNDSRLTVLRIDPSKVTFEMHCATETDKTPRTVAEWADSFDLNIVFNAGMYDLAHKLISRGYLKNHDHVNQGTIHPTFNSMLAFHPLDTTKNGFDIIDLQCQSWQQVKAGYHSYAQGLRMLDCDGKPMSWTKRKQSCSMLVAAKDGQGRLILVFTRSPYLHNEMIRFLQQFPMKLTHAIYLEGGPETSLFVRIGDTKIEKVGSYVSQTYENDLNDHFWKLPNVIGIKLKQQ
jgi:hypothetical protein